MKEYIIGTKCYFDWQDPSNNMYYVITSHENLSIPGQRECSSVLNYIKTKTCLNIHSSIFWTHFNPIQDHEGLLEYISWHCHKLVYKGTYE